jgi:hypothetical protein
MNRQKGFEMSPMMRSAAAVLTLLAGIGLAPSASLASFDGRTDGATDCSPCHGSSATGGVSVSITGSSTLTTGETSTYTLTIGPVNDGGALNVAITSASGTLGNLDSNTQLDSGEITHLDAFSSGSAGNIGDWTYDFTVTAGNTIGQTITIAAVGMQFVSDFDNGTDDIWNSATPFGISVVPEPGTGLLLGGGLLAMGMVRRRQRGARS